MCAEKTYQKRICVFLDMTAYLSCKTHLQKLRSSYTFSKDVKSEFHVSRINLQKNWKFKNFFVFCILEINEFSSDFADVCLAEWQWNFLILFWEKKSVESWTFLMTFLLFLCLEFSKISLRHWTSHTWEFTSTKLKATDCQIQNGRKLLQNQFSTWFSLN